MSYRKKIITHTVVTIGKIVAETKTICHAVKLSVLTWESTGNGSFFGTSSTVGGGSAKALCFTF